MFKASVTSLLLLICMTLFCADVFAGDDLITDIRVKGNRRIETAAILNAVKEKVGDTLDPAKVDEDVRNIFKLGHFQDVQADREKSDRGSVLTFILKEKPVVREIIIDGTKELTLDKVKEAVEIRKNTIFSPKDLSRSIKKIKKLYADEGYYLAEVDGSFEKLSDTEVKAHFTIREGEKVLITKIIFEGNKAFSDGKIKGVMETSEAWMFSWLTGAGTYKEDVLKNDVNLIADLYYNNGYVNVKVGEPRVEVVKTPVLYTPYDPNGEGLKPEVVGEKAGLHVTIGITEGEQFRAGTIGFKGDLLETAEELSGKLKMKTGDVFSRAVLRNDVFTLTDLYADKGYAFANATPLSKANAAQKTIDITYDMEKGEKVYIDRINISGNTKTRDKVIRRELKLADGDLYGSTPLKRSKQNLMNLGYFEEANLVTAKGSADNKLDLNVDVKEKATGTFSIGAGYSSLDGFIGQGSVQQSNFLGLGLKANLSAAIGAKSTTYNLGLTDPYFLDTKWTLGADIYRTERQYIDYTRRATGGDIKAGYPLSDTLSTFWLYKYEKKEIYDESQALLENIRRGLIQPPESSSTTSSITASITSNTTDYRLDPTSGMMNTLSVEYAGLGGSNRFARYVTETAWFHKLVWSSVFSLRGTLGHIQGVGKDAPIDEKFYLGGINTLRGYSSRTVSPYKITNVTLTDANGIRTDTISQAYVGGDTEAVFNAEITIPLLKDAGLKGVLFFDAGNSYDTTQKFYPRLQTSYGWGIRWFSPIGPLRLEYGIPINPRAGIDASHGRLEFSIGNFF